MNDDHFDGLVNDATHAVTNLIPDTVLDGLRDRERSDLLFQINDALTPILRDVIDRTDTDNPTRASTVAALISELLETHAQHPEQCLASAVPYLRLCGTVLGGWLSARAAEAAAAQLAAGTGETAFLQAKLVTARHYTAHVLVQAPALCNTVQAGAISTLALDEQQF